MRVVIDTNVIVSGLRSTSGAGFRVLRGIRSGSVIPVVTTAVFLEYKDVLGRPGLLPSHMPKAAVSSFLDAFLLLAEQREVHFLWRPSLPDPQDECHLEAALAAGCVPIVTYNLNDFRPAEELGIRLMTPWQLATELQLPE